MHGWCVVSILLESKHSVINQRQAATSSSLRRRLSTPGWGLGSGGHEGIAFDWRCGLGKGPLLNSEALFLHSPEYCWADTSPPAVGQCHWPDVHLTHCTYLGQQRKQELRAPERQAHNQQQKICPKPVD
uniref:Bm11918 n=1 Tax=Brugia malayi TaxID=6279 RepID=A0A1I9G9W6_BRUMA|nr:Bm11918 [Brugia malayi]